MTTIGQPFKLADTALCVTYNKIFKNNLKQNIMNNFNSGSNELQATNKQEPVIQVHSLDNYKEPITSKVGIFFNPPDGDSRIRIVSPAFVKGFQTWDSNKKPIRFVELPQNLDPNFEKPKNFKAIVIWDYKSNCLMMYVITQKSILETLEKLSKPDVAGPITGQDLIISRTGNGQNNVRYAVAPCRVEPIAQYIQQIVNQTNVNWAGLFDGSQIFTTKGKASQPVQVIEQKIDNNFPF